MYSCSLWMRNQLLREQNCLLQEKLARLEMEQSTLSYPSPGQTRTSSRVASNDGVCTSGQRGARAQHLPPLCFGIDQDQRPTAWSGCACLQYTGVCRIHAYLVVYYYPGKWILHQFSHSKCTFSTPWGAFRPVAILQACTSHANSTTITFASYQIPVYTSESRAPMRIKCLAEGQKYRSLVGIVTWALRVRVERLHQYTRYPMAYMWLYFTIMKWIIAFPMILMYLFISYE